MHTASFRNEEGHTSIKHTAFGSRVVRYPFVGQHRKPFDTGSSALLAMSGALGFFCGKLCHFQSDRIGTGTTSRFESKYICLFVCLFVPWIGCLFSSKTRRSISVHSAGFSNEPSVSSAA